MVVNPAELKSDFATPSPDSRSEPDPVFTKYF
jgi:hypothetical protein